jgi:hypothetical protein
MLTQPNVEGPGQVCAGLLIDFDYAALIRARGSRAISAGFRTVHFIYTLFQFDLLILHHLGYTTFYGY